MSFNPFTLEDKTIIITGASSGIGRQCAIDCSKMGAKVVLIARNKSRLIETISMMESPEKHSLYSIDLSQLYSIKPCVDEIIANSGKISGIVHAAGISTVLPLKMLSLELLDHFFKTNVYSALSLTKEVCRMGNYSKMGCSVIFFSSIMGCVGEKGKSLYSATKGALISASRSLAVELAVKNIRVNTISPGAIETPINTHQDYMSNVESRKILEDKHPLGLGMTTDISNVCIFLLSDASRWITGQNLIVDGGYTAL